MDLISFMKTALYKIIVIVTIATMVFTTLGIQPVGASTSIPETLHPVEQLNVQKDSNGALTDASPYSDPDIFSVSYNYNYVKNMYMTDLAAIKFTVDTSRPILSAQLTLSGINEDINNDIFSNLTVRIGDNDWNSNFQNSDFPDFIHGTPAKVETVEINDGGYTYQNLIDVTNLVTSPSAISGNNVTFILTSDSSNMSVAKLSDSLDTEVWPSLKITYGEAQQNSAPTDITLSSASVEENQPSGTTVGTLSAIDSNAGDTFTYSLVSGAGATDNSSFSIAGNELRTSSSFDYETKNSYSVRMKVTDKGGLTFEKVFTILISNVNEAPTDISLSADTVAENQPLGTKVGTFSATDSDAGNTFTYSLVSGAGATDNSSFSIVGNELRTTSSFDFETKNSYSVRVRVTDQGGLSFEKPFTISVTDIIEAPIPTIVSTVPVNNATNVSTKPTLTLNFSKAISGVAGKHLRIYDQHDSLIESIEATSTNVTMNGSSVSIQLSSNLIKAMTYYVLMDNGAFVDTDNQEVAGITANNVWHFTTLLPSNNADLSNLTVLTHNLNPSFSSGQLHYQVNVAHNVTTIDVIPTTADSNATITFDGKSVTNAVGKTISLNVGNNAIPIIVTAEYGLTTKTYTIDVTRALPSLEKVKNVSLSTVGIATWSNIDNESSYEVQLYKDSQPIGSAINVLANKTAHSFLEAMRAAGSGVYTVKVTAKGDGLTYLDGDTSASSNTQTIIKLATVTDSLSWDGSIAKWQSVPKAVSYDVLLYKDSAVVGTVKNILAENIQDGVDFTAELQLNGIGSYTFTVQPKGDGALILDGNQGTSSEPNIISPVTYTVMYNGNGSTDGTAPIDSAKYGQNADVVVSANDGELVKTGHIFTGWNTKADGTGTYYSPNDSFKMGTENVTLFAQWAIKQFTVSFVSNGGTTINSKQVQYNSKITAEQPVKSGYVFEGWYKDAALTTAWNFVSDVITENITLYAKWGSINTGGGNTNPPANNSGSESTPPSSEVEDIVVDVESGDGTTVSKTTIKRTKNADGTFNDAVVFTEKSARETIAKLKEQASDKARIVIPDLQDKIKQINVSIPSNIVSILKQSSVNLEIDSINAKIEIPKSSINSFDNDLYFRLIPIKAAIDRLEIENRVKQETQFKEIVDSKMIQVLGRPMTIETNMQNRPVTLTLPLPNNLSQEQLNNLAIYIEHSDGTKELLRGKVVDYQKDMLGVQFEVTKFSTFSILYLPVDEEPTTDDITHTPYIQGYADGTFRPNASVTRAQMASMFARQLTGNAIPQAQASYTDTMQHDAKDAIEFVKNAGLFNGVTETSFNPNGFITRAQMAAVAARWIEKHCVDNPNADFCKTTSEGNAFKDVSNNHWAVQAIDTVYALGIMTGTTADTFNPDGNLTRAQAVKVLNHLFERQAPTELQSPIFKDVQSNHWAFYEIQEAAVKHTHNR